MQTTFVLGTLLYLAFLKLSRVAGWAWVASWVVGKSDFNETQSSVWTWTLDFDLGFVNC